jgi:hypothetical protein
LSPANVGQIPERSFCYFVQNSAQENQWKSFCPRKAKSLRITVAHFLLVIYLCLVFSIYKVLVLVQVYPAKMARSSEWRTCCPGWQARKATPASPAWRAGRASRVYPAWPARMADRAGKAMWDQLGPMEYQVKKVIFRIFFFTFSAFLINLLHTRKSQTHFLQSLNALERYRKLLTFCTMDQHQTLNVVFTGVWSCWYLRPLL